METEENITLREGLEQFYRENVDYFGHHNLAMSERAKAFLRAHDVAHVLFDCDISLYGEGSVKIWTIFGTTLGFWKHISEYKEAQAFELAKTFNFWHVVNNIFKFLFAIPIVIYRTRLELLFGTENEGFCGIMKSFFGHIARATGAKNDKIRAQNAKFAGKRTTQDEFIEQKV